MTGAAVLLAALLFELTFGWPDRLYRRIRHPVVWMGWLIERLQQRCNRPEYAWRTRYALGAVAALLVVTAVTLAALAVRAALPAGITGALLEALAASSLLAARSLHAHVRPLVEPLRTGDLQAARAIVQRLVSRDAEQLGDAEIARAGLESLAENASDAVVAPLFWGLLFGLPGIAAYKAVNTLDSMVGHRTPALEAFGGFSARLDDVANLIPARLTALMLIGVAGRTRASALRVTRQDARRHRSPNAGWPEAALAGALGVRLSGPRRYAGRCHPEPWLNAAGRDPDASDLERGLALYRRTIALLCLLLAIIACAEAGA